MIGEMERAGLAYGHSGVGHDSVSSLYCFPELPDIPWWPSSDRVPMKDDRNLKR